MITKKRLCRAAAQAAGNGVSPVQFSSPRGVRMMSFHPEGLVVAGSPGGPGSTNDLVLPAGSWATGSRFDPWTGATVVAGEAVEVAREAIFAVSGETGGEVTLQFDGRELSRTVVFDGDVPGFLREAGVIL